MMGGKLSYGLCPKLFHNAGKALKNNNGENIQNICGGAAYAEEKSEREIFKRSL